MPNSLQPNQQRIAIIDYGMGNLRSVQKALETLNCPAAIVSQPTQLDQYPALILPGVGAFRDAIAELKNKGFVQAIEDFVQSGRPFLGICLGMQLLFDRSFEDGDYEGLGLISGDVVRFQPEPELKIPHMGWNSLEIPRPNPLLNEIQTGDYVYFVHSYHVRPNNPDVVTAMSQHGSQEFVCIVNQQNLFATQFHPEKSQRVGLQILKNFIDLIPEAVAAS